MDGHARNTTLTEHSTQTLNFLYLSFYIVYFIEKPSSVVVNFTFYTFFHESFTERFNLKNISQKISKSGSII